MSTQAEVQSGAASDCLAGGGDMALLMRSKDWSESVIGSVDSWSPALRMMVSILLANRFPLLLWWGPSFCQLYNDAYRPMLGTKHPHSLGQAASECWAEIWHVIGPLIEKPFRSGEATWMDDIFLEINRHGFVEETHFTVAYSPVPDETVPSRIGGVLATVYEITDKVVGERRALVLRDLGVRSSEAKTADQACRIAAETLAQHTKDVPFALLYLIDGDSRCARLAGAAGVEMGKAGAPLAVELAQSSPEQTWPLAEALRSETIQIVEDLPKKLSHVPPGPWSEPPPSAIVLPIPSNMAHELAGLLVCGVSSRLRFDNRYRDFFGLVASQVTTTIANARAYENERKRAEALAEIERVNRETLEREHELRRSAQEAETRTKQELAAELMAMNRLHEFSTRLLTKTELQPLLEEVLNATITLQNADFGNVQLYDVGTGALKIVAQSGFNQDFLDHFSQVNERGAACGRAMLSGKRVIIEDVLTDPDFAPHRAVAASVGFRAVQSTPLFSHSGELLGMVSTHFRRPNHPLQRELRLTDLYARQAAEMIERKRAEEALRVSEERFRRYFDLGLIGMAITSPAKGCLEVNDELCRILGYERSELLQKTWAEMTHPDDLAADVAQFNRVMAGEIEGYSLDKRWIRKDGRVIHSIMAARCLRRADHSVDCFVGLVLDTSERQRAEAALRRSEANLAEGQGISHTGSWAWNASSGEMFCSKELLRIFGLHAPNAKRPHEDFLRLIHQEDQPRVREAFERAVRTATDYDAEYRIVRSDGSIRHIHNLARPVLSESGALIELVGTAVDITERKRAEEKLSESERRFRLLVESIPHHVWSFRSDGSVGYWNQRLIDYTGLTEEELRLGGWAALHPDEVERVKAAWEKAWATGTQYEMEQRMRGRDGRYRRFVCRGVAVKDAQGQPIEWFGTDTDVEERRRAEEALHKTQAALARVARITTMGELAASIAHEINQPLGAIVNNGNACVRLFSQSGSKDEIRAALTDIASDAKRASAIIARIRALTNRSAPEKTSLQLNEVISEVLALAHGELAERGIEVRTELPKELPRVSADRVQLQQVFLNLIINGLEAMSAVEEDLRVLTIRGQCDELHGKPAVRISVQDLGRGIAQAAMAHLFEAFYSTKPHGMGMGLRIGTSIVEAHGGRLWVTPNAGPGVTFSCALPTEAPKTL